MRKGFRLRPLLDDVRRPFDQTNGMIRYQESVPRDGDRTTANLVATGVAVSAITVGFFGGGI